MLRSKNVLAAVAAVVISASAVFAVTNAEILKALHCPVSDQAVSEKATAEWHEGKVYFCCEKCQAAFKEDSEKFVAKANMQLVASKQYEQKACPLTGGKLNESTAIEVGDAKVAFCCENCQGKAKKMEDAERIDTLFSEKAFEKAKFVKVEEKKK